METTKDKLLKLWQQAKDEGAWSFFGGVFTVDGQKWQVIPEGRAWVDGKLVNKEPIFVKVIE